MVYKHNCGVQFVECMAYDNVPCVLFCFVFFHAYFSLDSLRCRQLEEKLTKADTVTWSDYASLRFLSY